MKHRLIRSSLLALVSATILGCGGGGSDGTTTLSPSSSVTPAITTSGATNASVLSTTAMANLSIAGSVQGVTINSPPVITFQLVNSDNNTAVEGIQNWTTQRTLVKNGVSNQSGGTTDACRFYPNLAFSIAKLVPGSNGSPAKWVSYMVSTPTLDTSCNATGYTPGRPGSENNGTLEYLGNGQYKYTFRRDITKASTEVATFTDTASSKQADLGNLTYDPNAVHRLVIQVSGPVRGARSSATTGNSTYCNTADGSCPAGSANTAYEIIRTPADLVFDWIPATGRVVKASDTDVVQREVVNVVACASCHNKFTFHGGDALSGYGGGRQETRQCVVCHTDQRKFGRTGTTTMDASGNFSSASTYTINGISSDDNHSLLDFPVMIHKIHMGNELTRTGYNIAGVKPNEIKYPQLITNCAKCHSGDTTKPDGSANTVTKQDGSVVQMATVQGNNWNTKPNRLACGACHDGINYNTGAGKTLSGASTGHGAGGVGGAQADDAMCSTCHTSAAIKKVHVAVTPQNRNSSMFSDCATFATSGSCNGNTNAAWIASNLNNLPAGAIKITYDVKSVARVVDATDATKFRPQIVFRFLQNGQRVDFNTFSGSTDNAVLTNEEMLANFMGSPSAQFVWAVPQDGITTPADFNASASGYLRSIWNGKASGTGAGKLTGPDANGYYTVTLTGVSVPDNAVMLAGGLGFSYSPANTMPLTQTNLTAYPVTAATANGTGGSATLTAGMPNKTGGLIVIAPDITVVASSGAGASATTGAYAARRQIVEDARCNNCHQELGAFNKESFHAGQRNDGSTCSWCHTPNRTSSGWAADSTNFIHGIHGSLKRKNKFTWHAASATEGFWTIGYPGVLKNCEACHVPGSNDFSNAASKAAAGLSGGGDKRLFRYSATGTFKSKTALVTAGSTSSAAELTVFAYSPFVAQDTNYGTGFSFNAGTGATTVAGAANLLETPTASVCFACHDDDTTVKSSMGATAKAHMLANGGQIYAARGASNPINGETCLTSCHGPSSAANIKAVHAK